MNKAKENFIKLSVILLVIWFILLIVGFATTTKQTISNVFFGLGTIALLPIVDIFFKSKAIKNKPVAKADIENYLVPAEYLAWANDKDRLEKEVKMRKKQYWFSFSLAFSIFFIASAVLLIIL